jgi:nitrogen fixation NifU-like protein
MSDDLRDLYQDLILDHGKRPRNFRAVSDANHEALGHNPLCGDRISLYVTTDANGIIQDAAFQGSGCAISVASASMMTEMLKGKTTDATGLDEDAVDRIKALAGVRDYPIRVKCATLPWHTLQAALKDEKKVSTE